ncbi:hypothetical protein EV715DRAFT_291062 [Schizophyllum commune]
MSRQETLKEKIDTLRESIVYRMPIVWDTLPVKPDEEIKLFYGKPGDAHCLDIAHPAEDQLQHLEAACERATFGRNQEDVLDETYRKAGKMDTSNFSTNFSPPPSFLGHVRDELLQRHDTRLVYELYKLNVYGKDAFFKPHKDTPRGPSSYGTLIVVFPAPHTGGALIFSDPKHGECIVDAAAHILPTNGAPNLVCVAFYGDVTHEVRKVTSGHRVTLTWNIYTEDGLPAAGPPPPVVLDYDAGPRDALSSLLADDRLLPHGGYLGFGLRYEYPVSERSKLQPHHLKGGDSMIWRVCQALGLDVSIVYLYDMESNKDLQYPLNKREDASFVMTSAVDLGGAGNDDLGDEFTDAPVVRDAGTPCVLGPDDEKHEEFEVVWVTEHLKKNRLEELFVALGNDAYIDAMYGTVALFVKMKSRLQEEQ